MINLLRDLNLSARIGVVIVVVFLLAVTFGPMLLPYSAVEISGSVWEPPSATHWLGTDNVGRDLLARILTGGRMTVLVSFFATCGAFAIGCPLGIAAAITGGWFDLIVTRSVDALMAFPGLILALIVLSAIGTSIPSLLMMMAVLSSTIVFRLTRAVASDVAAMEYIEVARLRGETMRWFLFKEVLPNVAPTLFTEFGLRFVFAAILISSLSFLGLGIQPPYPDLGGMVKENALAITFGRSAPILPALALALLAIGVNLIVDGLLKRNANLDLHK
ncbi:ABC transporter permease [Cochlodiniinecator piscidefendens]|uniref:ABC transporter permease n=1 Tax=Cochlodiniinecator piscidefendens TaxID=2715756 RepID=UPI001407CFA8|nr:ABC transporter permease [Cochlodiniinecator piscidefendens]